MFDILVPTDFSDTAHNAFEYAYRLSLDLGGRVRLLHVYRPEFVQMEGVVNLRTKSEEQQRKRLEKYTEQVNKSIAKRGRLVSSEFKVGFVPDTIYTMCQNQGMETMIVLGSTGSSRSLKKMFGSVSLEVARRCTKPVLIIPPQAKYYGIEDIVYATDHSINDVEAGRYVYALAQQLKARLHLIHVNTDGQDYPEKSLQQTLSGEGMDVVYHEIKGADVVDALNSYTLAQHVSIVAMSTEVRGFLSDLFHKSVSKRMALQTTVPLLIIHV